MTTTPRIHPDEPLRYTGSRHTWNNGFRRLWLSLGAKHAAAINAARRGDFAAVNAFGHDTLGGLSQFAGWSKSAIKVAGRIDDDVPAYRIVGRMVHIPNLTWSWSGRRQVAVIEWLPMWGK